MFYLFASTRVNMTEKFVLDTKVMQLLIVF